MLWLVYDISSLQNLDSSFLTSSAE